MASLEGMLGFFAYLDEEPVATAVLRCDGGVAQFAGACTVPEARNQGAQGALLEARMKMAVSQRNAERQGFRIAYTRIKWQFVTGCSP
jgi:hypothetical protein